MSKGFDYYSSFYFDDEQRRKFDKNHTVPNQRPLLMIHGSHLVERGSGDYRIVASEERMRENLLNLYGEQFDFDPATYEGLLVADYEPQNGSTFPGQREPLPMEKLDELLSLCLLTLKQVCPLSDVAAWGHPSSFLWRPDSPSIPIRPEDLPATWDAADFVAFHDYTSHPQWTPGQREVSAARIAEAFATNLPMMQVVWPVANKQGVREWIEPDALRERVLQGKGLGCFACCYWDSPKFGMPHAVERWGSDLAWLEDLVVEPAPFEPLPPLQFQFTNGVIRGKLEIESEKQ